MTEQTQARTEKGAGENAPLIDDARTRGKELLLVLAVSLSATLAALAWSMQRGALLMFGDAEAHLHIARRLFDSHRPGITQLGSVWLPLPHLLLVPFVAVDGWWRSGFAGAIPSAAEYVIACLGIYWLARKWLSIGAAWVVLVVFAGNPNLLYLSTTAMTEPLFLAELIWTVALLVEWREAIDAHSERRAQRVLWLLIGILIAAVATRYDGWILGLLVWAAMAVVLVRRKQLFGVHFIGASIALLAAPVAWLVYNARVFGDSLEFIRGPYSAYAIERHAAAGLISPHPGWHNPWVALVFFTKAAEMVAAVGIWGQLLLALSLFGAIWAWRRDRTGTARWTLLLWIPLPFYCYSVAYGSVPIFLPVWWPYTLYNTRYGLELLPALALFAGFSVQALLLVIERTMPRHTQSIASLLVACAVLNAVWVARHNPLVLAEALKNHEARWAYEYQIATRLRFLHRQALDAIILMDTSAYPQIVPDAGLTYKQTLNESDKQYYQAALTSPQQHVSIAVAFADDAVEQAMKAHPTQFRSQWIFSSTGQPQATIYVSDTLSKNLHHSQ